ncbi:hypothetical protein [Phenylobacterium sp.]|uniref:hypothetical protein n=1 Tax=Phenylobacterium sp. TaxID=1871053 RepID=UPI0025D70681|nr:hypothetical protein [Phenylobacterium sp.]
MKNSDNAIVVAERIVSDAEGKADRKLEVLAHAQAQTVLLKALLQEITGLRADLAGSKAKGA